MTIAEPGSLSIGAFDLTSFAPAPMNARDETYADSERGAGETSKTLDRALRLLRMLAQRRGGATAAEIAVELRVHRAAVYRLLRTLEQHRIVVRSGSSRYDLGLGLLELAGSVRADLHVCALPELNRLAEAHRATAALTIRSNDEAVVVGVVEPPGSHIHVAYRVGLRHPIDRGASGIAILAASPPAQGERAAVREARERGYAVSRSELEEGAFGVSAGLAVGSGPAEASVGIISLRPLEEAVVGTDVRVAADAIAAALSVSMSPVADQSRRREERQADRGAR
jgi:DNA-binding IclR family transcriptional regulator